jgi:hypothetical protein
MCAFWAALLLAPWGFALATEPGSRPECSAAARWQAGLEAQAELDCSGEAGEAYLLARELARLRDETKALNSMQQSSTPSQDGARQRRLRQLQIDIEAIEAEARLRGWSG